MEERDAVYVALVVIVNVEASGELALNDLELAKHTHVEGKEEKGDEDTDYPICGRHDYSLLLIKSDNWGTLEDRDPVLDLRLHVPTTCPLFFAVTHC